MDNQDVVSGQIIVQKQSEKYLVQNIPAKPLVRGELDKVYALPYTRRYHPIYESMGGVPAIREVQFSIIQNRGCFGGCNFCAIQLHQGRRVTSRSADSIVAEAERMTHEPDFKGYIHDVGDPTANFRFPSCREQMLRGMCTGGKHCLAPTTCSPHDRGPQRLPEDPAPGAGAAGREKGVHPQRYPVRLPDGRPGRYLLQGTGRVPCVRPAEGGSGALCPQHAGLYGQAAHRDLQQVQG